MRPGLVLLGSAFVILGAATIVAFNLSPAVTTNEYRSTIPVQPFAPNVRSFALLAGTDAGSGTFTLTWNATVPANVSLYLAPGCVRPALACANGAPLASHSGLAGAWSMSGALHFPFLLVWHATGAPGGNFSASALETTQTRAATGLLDSVLVNGAAIVLGVVGAVALFLGVFLRGGVYARPPPPPRPPADRIPP
jgi:hypothetical protein